MSYLLDTILNIQVFAFIGLLIWLYFKKVENGDKNPPEG